MDKMIDRNRRLKKVACELDYNEIKRQFLAKQRKLDMERTAKRIVEARRNALKKS